MLCEFFLKKASKRTITAVNYIQSELLDIVSSEIDVGAYMNQIINKKPVRVRLVLLFVLIFFSALSADAADRTRIMRKKGPVIVIDPGHGGRDSGARGSENTLEKEVTLTLARLIAGCLEKDFNVILTRTGDYWLDSPGRTAAANHNKAALFLSIHASGSYLRKTDGATLFYHKGMTGSVQVSRSADSLSLSDGNGPIAWDDIQKIHLPASRLMAETIQSRLMDQEKFSKSSLKSAPLAVLAGANMPAVLLEIGYLTNPAQEKNLSDDDYLSELAIEICKGIDDFL